MTFQSLSLSHTSGRDLSFLTRGKLGGKRRGQWFGNMEGMGSLALVVGGLQTCKNGKKNKREGGVYRS